MGQCSQNEYTRQLQKTKPSTKEFVKNFGEIDWSYARSLETKENGREEKANREATTTPE